MTALYNDIDPVACDALEELVARGVIAPGVVDRRSITELTPDDVKGYTQVHFFAGAGCWSVSARSAGWADGRAIWTASCPCQPFSAAGKGRGENDPRHLWPHLFRLVRAVRPAVLVGEQVGGKLGYGWLDGVRSDLEREDYASRAVDLPACADDAPQQRNRLFWIALADSARDGQFSAGRALLAGRDAAGAPDVAVAGAGRGGRDGRPEDAQRRALERTAAERVAGRNRALEGANGRRQPGDAEHRLAAAAHASAADAGRGAGAMGGPDDARSQGLALGQGIGGAADRRRDAQRADGRDRRPNGSWWADAEWIVCADGKARRAKPDLRLLVDGMAGRADLWRLCGNSIVVPLAIEVIKALKETLDCDVAS